MKEFVKMTVSGVVMDPNSNLPVVMLRDETGRRLVPIWIGVMEASSIAAALEGVDLPRPMTHDLLKTILSELGARVLRVDVTRIEDSTFYATLTLSHAGRMLEIDARPSDAIALAVRTQCEVGVAREVLEAVGTEMEESSPVDLSSTAASDPEKLQEILASLPPEVFGKWKM